jgi:hypothetical protein
MLSSVLHADCIQHAAQFRSLWRLHAAHVSCIEWPPENEQGGHPVAVGLRGRASEFSGHSVPAGMPHHFYFDRSQAPALAVDAHGEGNITANFNFSGVTVLVDSHWSVQHFPHFAEATFRVWATLARMQAECKGPINVVFHSYSIWGGSQNGFEWHRNVLSTLSGVRVLNPDFSNSFGAHQGPHSLCKNTPQGTLSFEHLVGAADTMGPLVEMQEGNTDFWFPNSGECELFRSTMIKQSGVMLQPPSSVLILQRSTRGLHNVEALQSFLRARFSLPVKVAHFDDRTSFAEQVGSLSGAKVLVTPHGAGEVNMAFMEKGGIVVEV